MGGRGHSIIVSKYLLTSQAMSGGDGGEYPE
jgi:hypothetical protein